MSKIQKKLPLRIKSKKSSNTPVNLHLRLRKKWYEYLSKFNVLKIAVIEKNKMVFEYIF